MLFLRAVVTGFGLTLGAALFKKHVAKRLGLEEEAPAAKKTEEELARDGATDPHLRS
jgi:heme oxygenase